jgi:hypothetical protein
VFGSRGWQGFAVGIHIGWMPTETSRDTSSVPHDTRATAPVCKHGRGHEDRMLTTGIHTWSSSIVTIISISITLISLHTHKWSL